MDASVISLPPPKITEDAKPAGKGGGGEGVSLDGRREACCNEVLGKAEQCIKRDE